MMNLMPFLLFDGNCAEAMAFYQSCRGVTLEFRAGPANSTCRVMGLIRS